MVRLTTDYVLLLIDRIERDESIRVRRMAMVMLANARPQARLVKLFRCKVPQSARIGPPWPTTLPQRSFDHHLQ